jgi:phosphoribosylaminoimidazole-succinocarboxamide synthase
MAELIRRGKTKSLWRHKGRPGQLVVLFSDLMVGEDGNRVETIKGKGIVGSGLTALTCSACRKAGIPTHYVGRLTPRALVVSPLQMIPLEVVVRGVSLGSLSRRYGLKDELVLARPIVEFFLKNDALGDPLIGHDAASLLLGISRPELEMLEEEARSCWAITRRVFSELSLDLLDIKYEFGRDGRRIVLGDEVGFDTARFADVETGLRLDKDVWYVGRPGAQANVDLLLKRLANVRA